MTAFYSVVAVVLAMFVPLDGNDPFEFGSRPPTSIFEGTGSLEPAMLKELSADLARIRKADEVDVVVVVLQDLEGAPPNYVAGRFAEEWCDAAIHAVVLHVPGDPESPWIHPAGRMMGFLKPDRVSERVAEAKRRASLEVTDSEVVRAAAEEATDMLRYWKGTAINRREVLETTRTRMKLELEAAAWKKKLVLLCLLALAIPLVVVVSMLVSFIRSKGALYFPESGMPRRLGGPQAGGNSVLVSLEDDKI